MSEGKKRYQCPSCGRTDSLWRAVDVPGWQGVDDELEPRDGRNQYDVDWGDAYVTGTYGCGECSWEGLQSSLVPIGLDGEPLPTVHPAQMKIDA